MIPTQDMTPYPTFGDNSPRVQPDPAKYAAGFQPGDVVPAEWFNWLLNRGSSATTKLNAGTLSMEQEINNVLTAGAQTPDATQTNQLLTAINYIINQVRLEEQQKIPVGVPTIWMGPKPDWALDFGNGAGTKYLWSNYPKLNNDKFKSILSTLSDAGWMTAHDTEGFYVPDLRGIVPIGYGGPNGKRTVETTSGGNLGAYLRSQNLYHAHSANATSLAGDNKTGKFSIDVSSSGVARTSGHSGVFGSPTYGNNRAIADYTGTSWTPGTINFSMTPTGTVTASINAEGGAMAKPPTIAIMWIVRFD